MMKLDDQVRIPESTGAMMVRNQKPQINTIVIKSVYSQPLGDKNRFNSATENPGRLRVKFGALIDVGSIGAAALSVEWEQV